MKNKIYSCLFFFAITLLGLAANRQYVPADMSSIATNSFESIIATNDVCCTQSTVQAAFEWVDDNFPTNISKSLVYATQSFVSNNFYLQSNPSNFLTPAAASNLFYPLTSNPSNYLQVVAGSNIVDYTITADDIASNTITIVNIETNYMNMLRISSVNKFAITNNSSSTTNIVSATNSSRARIVKWSAIFQTKTMGTNNIDELNLKADISSDNATWINVVNRDIFFLEVYGYGSIFFQIACGEEFFVPAGWWYRMYLDPASNVGSLTNPWTNTTVIVESVP